MAHVLEGKEEHLLMVNASCPPGSVLMAVPHTTYKILMAVPHTTYKIV